MHLIICAYRKCDIKLFCESNVLIVYDDRTYWDSAKKGRATVDVVVADVKEVRVAVAERLKKKDCNSCMYDGAGVVVADTCARSCTVGTDDVPERWHTTSTQFVRWPNPSDVVVVVAAADDARPLHKGTSNARKSCRP